MHRFHPIEAQGTGVTLDLLAGHVRQLLIAHDRPPTPFRAAPWVDDLGGTEELSIDAGPRHLSVASFYTPFATSDVEGRRLPLDSSFLEA